MDVHSLILALIAFSVPSVLLLFRRRDALLFWFCLTGCIDIFTARIGMNLPAARLAGLIVLPWIAITLFAQFRGRAGALYLAHYAWLGFLGIVFGFVFPWDPGIYDRAFNQIAPGRAVIYMIRLTADLAIVGYFAAEILQGRIRKVIDYLRISLAIASAGGLLHALTRIDFYTLFTGLPTLGLEYRARGFNYEPRVLALIAVYGLMLAMADWTANDRRRGALLAALHAGAILVAGSTSAIGAAVIALLTMILMMGHYRLVFKAAAVLVVCMAILVPLQRSRLETYRDNIRLRLIMSAYDQQPRTLVEHLAYRIDIFDGPALLFLADRPLYALIGAGPGLIPLPATDYIPIMVRYQWALEQGINSPPTTGFLLEISNGGIIALSLWIAVYFTSLAALRRFARSTGTREARIARDFFAAAGAVFAVQAGALTVLWPIAVGIGVGASTWCAERRTAVLGRTDVATTRLRWPIRLRAGKKDEREKSRVLPAGPELQHD